MGNCGSSSHAFLHDRNRGFRLLNVAFTRFLLTVSTLVGCCIIIDHRDFCRDNGKLRANVFFTDPNHLSAAPGADPLILWQLA